MTVQEQAQSLAKAIGQEISSLGQAQKVEWWRKFCGRWDQYVEDIVALPTLPIDLQRALNASLRDTKSALDIYVRPNFTKGTVIKHGDKVRDELQALFGILSRLPSLSDWPHLSPFDKSPQNYWHCYFGFSDDQTSYATALDLTKEELLNRVIAPWRAGRSFTLSGTVVDSQSVATRRRIVWTALPSKHYEHQKNARLAQAGILSLAGVGFAAFSEGEDFTDELLIDAPLASASHPNQGNPMPTDPREVFVIHGRNDNLTTFFFSLLRNLGLKPLEFQTLISRSGSASPYVADVVASAFTHATACVVLFTGDDIAQLRPELHEPGATLEPLTAQPRPNVLLEAGMALAQQRERTVIIEVPPLRGLSDLGGIHVVRFTGKPEERNDLANRLVSAGCAIERTGNHWLNLPFPPSPRGT